MRFSYIENFLDFIIIIIIISSSSSSSSRVIIIRSLLRIKSWSSLVDLMKRSHFVQYC